MPEGDSLRRVAARLTPALVGKPLVAVYDHGLARRSFASAVVSSVEARGKHLLIEVEKVGTIHVHLRMNGRVWVERRAGVNEGRIRGASLALVTDTDVALFTRTPVVEFLRTAFVHAHPALARLGPDLLDENVDFAVIVSRARAPGRASTTIAELLLDQRVAAGIGNVYKSEVLFLERVDPFARTDALDDETLARLYERAADLLRINLGEGRRTTTADRSRLELPPSGRGRYWVYNRVGRPCYLCQTPIESRLLGDGSRNTFYCPVCQAVKSPPPAFTPRPRIVEFP